jgi:phosphotriesterase-related protein
MARLTTTLGLKAADELGMILPHEHIFVDLRTWNTPGYAEADVADVVGLMTPFIREAQSVGITALVECSTVGVGRRADILKAVSEATSLPIVVPTGSYREPWMPDWLKAASEDALYDWMVGELTGQIETTGVRAGWIKLSAGDDGLTEAETKLLRAAARATMTTGAVIGSHTIRGRVVRDSLDIIESVGASPSRYIWIHTQAEPDVDLHIEMARRGAWLEFDAIGADGWRDEDFIGLIQRVLDAGFGDQLLLSHDRGWYDPAQPSGGTPKSFAYLSQTFLPKLRAAGIDDATIHQLTVINPYRAFASSD